MTDITGIIGTNNGIVLSTRNPQPEIYSDQSTKMKQLQDTVAKITDKEAEDRVKVLKDTCKEFESIFIYSILKSMRKTVLRSDLLHRGMAEDIYNSMFDQEIAKNISDGNGIGISSMIYQQLKVYKGSVDINKEDKG